MLLTTAKIESYYIGNDGHGWNLVRIGDKYYHMDITTDNRFLGNQYGTYYENFLKSTLNQNVVQKHPTDHPLLTVYNNDVSGIVKNCSENYPDANGDGILDYDFDLDGTALQESDRNEYNCMLQFCFGIGSMQYINTRMAEVLYHLHQSHKDYYAYMIAAAPTSVTVHAGEAVQLKVTLFGDDLQYQWWVRPRGSSGVWQYAYSDTDTLNLTAAGHMNNLEYCCWIGNKNYYSLYIYPITVTVI